MNNYKLGLECMKNKKLDDAINCFKSEIENNNCVKSMKKLAQIYQKKLDKDNAINYLEMAIKNGSVDAMCRLAQYQLQNKNYSEAIKYFKLAIDNDNIIAIRALALYYRKNGDFDNAYKYYKLGYYKGDEMCKNSLNKIMKNEKDVNVIVEYYKLLFENGDYKLFDKFLKFIIKNFDKIERYKILSLFKLIKENHLKNENKLITNIFKTTTVFPIKENINEYLVEYMTLLEISRSRLNKLPHTLTKYIAGLLFI